MFYKMIERVRGHWYVSPEYIVIDLINYIT